MKTLARLIALINLAIFHSCRSAPDLNRTLLIEQCGLTLAMFPNGEINTKDSFCECREYKYSLEYMGGIAGTTTRNPLVYCNKLVGNKPKSYLNLVNFLGDIRRDIQDNLP